MWGITGFLRSIAVLACVSLTACGGGGGGGGGASSASSFSINRNTVAFNAVADGATPPPQTVDGTVVNVNSNVFLFVTVGGTAAANASVALTSDTTGTLTIFPRAPSSLGPGTFTDSVVLMACLDSACNQPIPGSPKTIAVTYSIAAATTSQPQPPANPPVPPSSTSYIVNGTVTGLHGQGLVLQNNGKDDVAIAADGAFAFSTAVAAGASFNVTVLSQPTRLSQTCFVARGSGVATQAIMSVSVSCTATKQMGTSGDDEARAATTDINDDLLVAGRTTGSFAAVNAGGWDAFVVKFSSDGALLWQQQLGSNGDESANVIKTDSDGNVYVAGSTSGSLDGNQNAGSEDIFLTKFDKNGNKQWTRLLGTPESDVANGMVLTNDNNIYLVGRTDGVLGAASAGQSDIFFAKFDTTGNMLFVRQLGSDKVDVAYGVDTDSQSNAYIAGGTFGNLDGKQNASGGEAGFVVVYDAAGTKVSSQLLCQNQLCFGPTPSSTGRINAIQRAVGNVTLIAGRLQGSDFFYGQLSDTGGLTVGTGTGVLPGSSANAAILGRGDGLIYVVGTTTFQTTFPDSSVTVDKDINVQRAPLSDIFGSTNTLTPRVLPVRAPADEEGFGVASDLSSNVYAVGRTTGSVDNNPNLGGSDFVVVRFDAAGVRQ